MPLSLARSNFDWADNASSSFESRREIVPLSLARDNFSRAEGGRSSFVSRREVVPLSLARDDFCKADDGRSAIESRRDLITLSLARGDFGVADAVYFEFIESKILTECYGSIEMLLAEFSSRSQTPMLWVRSSCKL